MITYTITIGGADYSASLISANIRKNDVLYGKIASNEATVVLDGKVFPDKGTSATISINSETQFTGIVDHSTYSYKDQRTTISLKDKMSLWQNTMVPNIAFVDTTFDNVLNYLVSTVGGETNISLESVDQAIPYIYFKDIKLMDALQKMVSAVGGSMFYDETGELVFRAGMFSKLTPNSINISVDDIKNLNYKEASIVSAYTVKTSNKHETKDKRLIYTYSTSGAGTIDQTDSFTGDGSTTKFTLSHTATDTNYTVLISGAEIVDVTKTTTDFTFGTAPVNNAPIKAVYQYSDPDGAIIPGGLTFWAKFDNPVVHLDDYATATSADQWKADSHLSLDETTYNSNFNNGINTNFDRFKVKINNSDSVAHNVEKFILKGYPIIEDTIEQTYKVGNDNTQQSIQDDVVHTNFWAGNLAKYLYQAQPSFEFDVPLANFPSVLNLHIGDKIIVSADTSYSGVITDIQIGLSSNSLSGKVHAVEEPPAFTFNTDFPDTPQMPSNPVHFTDGVPPAVPSFSSIDTGITEGQTGYKTAYVDIIINPSVSTDVISYEYGYSYDNTTWFNAGTTAADDYTYRIPGLKQGASVYVRVRANDSEGYSSPWVAHGSITLPTDSSAPSTAPTLSQVNVDNLTITLSWTAVSDDDLAGYELQYDDSGSSFPSPNTLKISALGTTLTLAANTWNFRVRAYDALGHVGPWSNVITATLSSPASSPVTDPSAPNAPTGLSYSAGYKLIWLNWTASTSANVKEYVIQRAITTSGGSVDQSTLTWNDLTSINATRYTDSDLDTSNYYAYRVAAKNFNGDLSGWAYWASDTATNPIQPNANATQLCDAGETPSAPTNVWGVAGIGTVAAGWDMNNSPCFSHFEIHWTITEYAPDGSQVNEVGNWVETTVNSFIKKTESYLQNADDYQEVFMEVQAINLLGNASGYITIGTYRVLKVGTDWISDNAIVASKIAANAVVASKIAAGTITGDKIAGSTITGDHLTATVDLTTKQLTVGASDSSKIVIGDNVVNNGTEPGILVRNGAIEVLDASNSKTYLSPQGIRQMFGVHSKVYDHLYSGGSDLELDTITVHLPITGGTTNGTLNIYLHYYQWTGSPQASIKILLGANTYKDGILPGYYSYTGIAISDAGNGYEISIDTSNVPSDGDIGIRWDCYVEYLYS